MASLKDTNTRLTDSVQYGEPVVTGGGGGGTPSDTVASATSYGISSAAGSATDYARGDHQHGTPSLPTYTDVGAAAASHTHAESDITNLVTDLARKAASSHTHAIADTTGLQTALDGKAASSHTHAQADVTNLATDLAAKAPLASPALTGTPTAPTATGGTNTTQVATTAFVQDAIAGVSGGGTPASSVVSETSPGQSAAVGVATTYARGDHTHGTPALPTPASIGAVGGSGTPTYVPVFTGTATVGDSIIRQVASKVGIGIDPSGAVLHVAVDNAGTDVCANFDGYGTSYGSIRFRAARGTQASPSALTTDDEIGGFGGVARNSSGWNTVARAAVTFYAAQPQTSTNQGTYLTLSTTTNNTATRAERVRLHDDGKVSIGTTSKRQLLTVAGVIESTSGGFKFPDGTTQASAASNAPVGSIVMYGAAAAPADWLLCDGSAVSRTTYSALYAVIGTTYGTGDGSTTFNLPNLRQRFPLGKAASGTGATLGGTGGAIDHTHSVSGTTGTPSGSQTGDNNAGTNSFASETHTHSFSATSGTNNPPYLVVNFIIKT